MTGPQQICKKGKGKTTETSQSKGDDAEED
jgi:hypothetical protein